MEPVRAQNGHAKHNLSIELSNLRSKSDTEDPGHDSLLSSPTYYDDASNDSDRAPLVKSVRDVETDSYDEDEKAQAAIANLAETSMTLMEGLRKYPKAVAWSLVISTCIIMEGYDTALLGGFYGFPSFQRKYGEPYGDSGRYQIPAYWASIMSLGTTTCTLIGLALNGWATEKFGYKPVILASLAAIAAFIAVPFFSPNMTVLLIGEMLCSIPWGVFQTLTTAYASEVCPVVLRAYLTTYVNMAWVIGIGLCNTTLRLLVNRKDDWAFRIPFAMQWLWPVPLFFAALFAPESPWWLIREGRMADAERSVRRLCSDSVDARNTLAMMKYTNSLEKRAQQEASSHDTTNEGSTYAECFRGTNLRRTEIAAVVWIIQTACGISFVNWGSYFLQVAGMDPAQAYSLTLFSSGVSFIGTLTSWVLMTYFGRRTLYMAGLSVMFTICLTIGLFTFAPIDPTTGQTPLYIVWTTALLFSGFHLTYGLTIGPVCYTVVSEIPSTRLRAKTVIIGRAAYIITELFAETLTPQMVQETGWNWKFATGFFWATSCAGLLVWCWFRLPEPKGRTYGELAVLFAKNVPAREFAITVVDPFEAEGWEGEVERERQRVKLMSGGGAGGH